MSASWRRAARLLLTVVTPVLDGEEHLAACIESVATQDGVAVVEHLVLDGGSTDRSVDIAREAASRHPHVRVVVQPDRGQSEAMNNGIALARGPILGFLNVDDVYLPGALARALDALVDAPEPSFFWGALRIVRPDGPSEIVRPGSFRPWKLLVGPEVHRYPLNPSAYFYHRSLHELAGGFDEADHYAMDADFLYRASFHVRSVIRTDAVLGEYRVLPGSKTYEAERRGEDNLAPVLARHRAALSPPRRAQVRAARAAHAVARGLHDRIADRLPVREQRPRPGQ